MTRDSFARLNPQLAGQFAAVFTTIPKPMTTWVVTLRYRGPLDRIVIQTNAVASNKDDAITLAREEYDGAAPPDSFISADAYPGPKDTP